MFVMDLNTSSMHPFDFCIKSYCQGTVFKTKMAEFNVFKIWSLKAYYLNKCLIFPIAVITHGHVKKRVSHLDNGKDKKKKTKPT